MNEARANKSIGKQASEAKGVVLNISNCISNINVKMTKLVVDLKNSFFNLSENVYFIESCANIL